VRTTARLVMFLLVASLIGVGPAAADQQGRSPAPRQTSSKGRWIGLAAGAGAGFAAGVWFGLSRFDDSINSDRKVWTSAIVGAAAGGLGGFFLGKSFDRRSDTRVARQALELPATSITLDRVLSPPCSVRFGCPSQ
jgi:hypothetical protein